MIDSIIPEKLIHLYRKYNQVLYLQHHETKNGNQLIMILIDKHQEDVL